jgi:hypothetical protein
MKSPTTCRTRPVSSTSHERTPSGSTRGHDRRAQGRIVVFDLPDPNVPVPAPRGRARRLQHFGLLGACSETMVIEQTGDTQILVVLKSRKVQQWNVQSA